MNPGIASPDQRRPLLRRAFHLAVFTIIYNLLEGGVSIGFGITGDSVALAGFGVDSLIEAGSALLVLWRLNAETKPDGGIPDQVDTRERRATTGIGIFYLLLAAGILGGAIHQLVTGDHPATTLPGVMIAVISLSFMGYLWRSKLRIAHALDSATLRADAGCSLWCIYLSLVLLAGSLLFHFFPGLWWADAVVAVIMAALVLKEGIEVIRAARQPEFSGACGCET